MHKVFIQGKCPHGKGFDVASTQCRQCEYFFSPGSFNSSFVLCRNPKDKVEEKRETVKIPAKRGRPRKALEKSKSKRKTKKTIKHSSDK